MNHDIAILSNEEIVICLNTMGHDTTLLTDEQRDLRQDMLDVLNTRGYRL